MQYTRVNMSYPNHDDSVFDTDSMISSARTGRNTHVLSTVTQNNNNANIDLDEDTDDGIPLKDKTPVDTKR